MYNFCLNDAIAAHRNMWNWIADNTYELKRIVRKYEYFEAFPVLDIPFNQCYCCQYALKYTFSCDCDCICALCPIDWLNGGKCMEEPSAYAEWIQAKNENDYKKAAYFARKIANLPMNDEVIKYVLNEK